MTLGSVLLYLLVKGVCIHRKLASLIPTIFGLRSVLPDIFPLFFHVAKIKGYSYIEFVLGLRHILNQWIHLHHSLECNPKHIKIAFSF